MSKTLIAISFLCLVACRPAPESEPYHSLRYDLEMCRQRLQIYEQPYQEPVEDIDTDFASTSY